ncbi:uncharacterized protein LOC135117521 [Helicoverpa armigera]|uniref:uncharacterized protein LOC135117521 n=1 Tax=Helicoverpa armigera TaxID=29058 RepID=UPI00308397BE
MTELDDPPSVEEFIRAVNQLKSGKSPGGDGTQAEIIKLHCVGPILHNLLCKCWEAGERSTVDMIFTLRQLQEKCREQKTPLFVAFVDLNKAFDTVSREDGKLFNISLLKSKKTREDLFVDSLLFADDAAFVSNSAQELQSMVDKFSHACSLFAMSINPKKTVVLAQGASTTPAISLDGAPLEVVDKFSYLGSTVSNNLLLNAEIDIRIGKAATMFGKLGTRVWYNKHLTTKTKMVVFQASILSILLYGAETWTSYAKQERRLNCFYMRCLRKILGITWQDRITNERVLDIAQLPSLMALLKQRRLRWLGHVHRMEPSRLPRRVLLGAVANAKRDVGRPLLRFKDCIKRDMAAFKIDHRDWEKLAEKRPEWRKRVAEGRKFCDEAWFGVLADKRQKRHEHSSTLMSSYFSCQACGKRCRSRIGLFSHERRCITDTTT